MKIVFTDIKTLGFDVNVSGLEELGRVKIYDGIPDDDISQVLSREHPDVSVIVTNDSNLHGENLKDLAGLKLICQTGTGYDNIDVDYCREQGIAVTNVPGYAGNSVAQFTFAMFFYLQYHCRYYDDFIKSGQYSSEVPEHYSEHEFYELEGKTWGVIGLGDIGRRVAKYAESFGCKVIWYSVTGNVRKEETYRQVALDELLEASDILSIHAPFSSLTYNLITMNELKKMKKTAILLNLGRGGIVNEADLAEALNEGVISAAGLDVLEKEPIEVTNPLLKLKDPNRVFITPHIAYGSVEARQRVMKGVCDSIRSFMEGGRYNRVD
ncbi:MAG: NAD(P)-dependent oxidoreductase [Anaerovoracaceae bacterium]